MKKLNLSLIILNNVSMIKFVFTVHEKENLNAVKLLSLGIDNGVLDWCQFGC